LEIKSGGSRFKESKPQSGRFLKRLPPLFVVSARLSGLFASGDDRRENRHPKQKCHFVGE
jgi:hypothetical protein